MFEAEYLHEILMISFCFLDQVKPSTQILSKSHLGFSLIRWAVGSFLHICYFCMRVFLFLVLRCRPSSRLPSVAALQPLCCRSTHSDAKLEDPFTLAQKDLTTLYDDIKKVSWYLRVFLSKKICCWQTKSCASQELFISRTELKSLCDYYFDGRGKAIRPIIVVLMARALNIHSDRSG